MFPSTHFPKGYYKRPYFPGDRYGVAGPRSVGGSGGTFDAPTNRIVGSVPGAQIRMCDVLDLVAERGVLFGYDVFDSGIDRVVSGYCDFSEQSAPLGTPINFNTDEIAFFFGDNYAEMGSYEHSLLFSYVLSIRIVHSNHTIAPADSWVTVRIKNDPDAVEPLLLDDPIIEHVGLLGTANSDSGIVTSDQHGFITVSGVERVLPSAASTGLRVEVSGIGPDTANYTVYAKLSGIFTVSLEVL